MLKIEREQMGRVAVLRLYGDVDEGSVEELRMALVGCLREEYYDIVLNLSGMKFISFMGVGVLVERLRQFRLGGGDMKLVGPNLYTERLLRMSGCTTLFETFDSEPAVMRMYQEAA